MQSEAVFEAQGPYRPGTAYILPTLKASSVITLKVSAWYRYAHLSAHVHLCKLIHIMHLIHLYCNGTIMQTVHRML